MHGYTLCNTFLRGTAIFSSSSSPLPGSVVGNLSGLNFSTSCPSQHVHQVLGWATVVLPVLILSGLKALFVHTSSGRAACCSAMISLSIFLSLLLAVIKSQEFQCDTTSLRERHFVPKICYLVLLKKVAIGFLPGSSSVRCGDRIWRLYSEIQPVFCLLLCYILGILRCYGNFQIFSFCKVRYLT